MRYFILLFSIFISAAHAQEARISYGIAGSYFLSPISPPRPFRIPGDYAMRSKSAFTTGVWGAYQIKPRLTVSINVNYVHRAIHTSGDIVDSIGVNSIGMAQHDLQLRGLDAILMVNYLHPLPNHNKLILGLGLQQEHFTSLPAQSSFQPHEKNLLYTFVDQNNANNTIHLDTKRSRVTVLSEIGLQTNVGNMGNIKLSLLYELAAGRDLNFIHTITPEPTRHPNYEAPLSRATYRTIQARLVWVMPPLKSKKSESQ